MNKIIIIGLTGAGKTTLAGKLGAMLNIPVFHLDQYFWKAGWRHVSQAEFYAMQEKIIAENSTWIMDGGFPRSKSLDLRIAHADTIIFFDLPVVIPLWRMAKRYFEMRGRERPDVGSGNKQQHPFTRADIKYAINYPRKDLHEKLAKVKSTKHVFVVKRSKDIATLLNSIDKAKL